MTDDQSRDIAHHLLAKSKMEDAQAYLSRGRPFQHTSLENLRDLFVQRYRVWVDNLKDHAAQRDCNDLGVEFELRDLSPPYELIRPELERFTSMVAAELEKASPERRKEINEAMVDEYLVDTKHRN